MQQGTANEFDKLGLRLSSAINCPVVLSSNARLFICKHGIAFSITRLRESTDTQWVKEKHSNELRK